MCRVRDSKRLERFPPLAFHDPSGLAGGTLRRMGGPNHPLRWPPLWADLGKIPVPAGTAQLRKQRSFLSRVMEESKIVPFPRGKLPCRIDQVGIQEATGRLESSCSTARRPENVGRRLGGMRARFRVKPFLARPSSYTSASSASNLAVSSVLRETNSPENFADKIVSLCRRYALGDEIRHDQLTGETSTTQRRRKPFGLDYNLSDHACPPPGYASAPAERLR